MILYRQKMFTSKKLKRRAVRERRKRNLWVLWDVAKGSTRRLGRQTVDLASNPIDTVKDVGGGIIQENKEGFRNYIKNAGTIVKPGAIPLSTKMKVGGKHVLLVTHPAAWGVANVTENFVDFSRKDGRSVVDSLAKLKYNPVEKVSEEVEKNVRRTRVLGGAGEVLGGVKGMGEVSKGLKEAGKTMTGVWYDRPGATLAEKSALGANIGVTPTMVGSQLGKSWKKRSGVDIEKEIEDFKKRKDVRGFIWSYDRRVAPKLNPIARKADSAKAAIDRFGKKSSDRIRSAGGAVKVRVQPIYSRAKTGAQTAGSSIMRGLRTMFGGGESQPQVQVQPIPLYRRRVGVR